MALAPQLSVTDAAGQQIFYVKQKLFKLKEAVNVFADAAQTRKLYTINADRILDFSAQYHFSDSNGAKLGSVKRDGMRSLWRARYNVLNGSAPGLTIREENPWIRVVDGVLNQIPLVGPRGWPRQHGPRPPPLQAGRAGGLPRLIPECDGANLVTIGGLADWPH